MPRYFMTGTKHEFYERMMMDPDRRPEPDDPEEEKDSRRKPNTKEGSAENNAVSSNTQ